MKFGAVNLRSKVISIIVLSALTLFFVYFSFLQISVANLEEELAEKIVRQETTIISDRAANFFNQDKKLIEQTLLRNEFQDFMRDNRNLEFRNQAITSIQYNCIVIDCNGWFIFSHETLEGIDWNILTGEVNDTELVIERDQWYVDMINSGRVYITDVNLHPIDQVPYVFLDYIVRQDDSILGLVGFFSSIERVVETILNFPDQGAVNFLIDEDGAIRASTSSDNDSELEVLLLRTNGMQLEQLFPLEQLQQFNDAANIARDTNQTTMLSIIVNESNYLVAIDFQNQFKWYSVSMFPYQDMTSIINTIPLFVITLIILFFFVVIAFFTLNRQMFTPIMKMNKALGEIASGNYEQRVNHQAKDELGFLANGINVMAEQIAANLNQIESQNEKLNQAIELANEANLAKSRFLANMSHELRSPMNAVLGFAQLGLDSESSEECLEYLTKLKQSGEHLTMIINDILDFSKIESDELVLEKIGFSYTDVINKVMNICTLSAEDKGLTINISSAQDIPEHLIGDPLRIEQILINLVNNAIKFTHDGTIDIISSVMLTSSSELRLQVSVVDSGIGMTETQQSRLFSAFTQADSSITRRYGGTGLGLAICKELVEAMHGTIGIESVEHSGSTFSFYILLNYSDTPLECEEANYNERLNKLSHSAMEKTVLVVEDNKTNQLIASKLLDKIGLECHLASHGQEGVDMATQYPYAIIYMDIQMPIMDGLTATQRILEHHPEAIIIGMSANASKEDIQTAIDTGMSAYITKPIDRDELYKTTAKFL